MSWSGSSTGFARSTRHLLTALEEFDHLGVRFISVQDQVDTESPMGRAMFTIIGAMAELESSLISERVTAGMRAADSAWQTHRKTARTPPQIVSEIVALATLTDLSIRQIKAKIAGRANRAAWSVRSPSGLASPHRHPCDHFLHVS